MAELVGLDGVTTLGGPDEEKHGYQASEFEDAAAIHTAGLKTLREECYDEGLLCDVVITATNTKTGEVEKIYSNMGLLAAQSEVLKVLFFGSGTKMKTDEISLSDGRKVRHLSAEEMSAEAVRIVNDLAFGAFDEIFINGSNLLQCLNLADLWSVPLLKKICVAFMSKSDVKELIQLLSELDVTRSDASIAFVIQELGNYPRKLREVFLHDSLHLIPESVMYQLIKHGKIAMKEEDIWEVMCKWAKVRALKSGADGTTVGGGTAPVTASGLDAPEPGYDSKEGEIDHTSESIILRIAPAMRFPLMKLSYFIKEVSTRPGILTPAEVVAISQSIVGVTLSDSDSPLKWMSEPRSTAIKPERYKQIGWLVVDTGFNVEFDITVDEKHPDGWASILHVGNTNGNRVPGMWLYPSETRLHARCDIRGQNNFGADPPFAFEIGRTYHIKFSMSAEHVLTLDIDGRQTHHSQHTFDQHGRQAVYLSDPWYQPALVTIENLIIDNMLGL